MRPRGLSGGWVQFVENSPGLLPPSLNVENKKTAIKVAHSDRRRRARRGERPTLLSPAGGRLGIHGVSDWSEIEHDYAIKSAYSTSARAARPRPPRFAPSGWTLIRPAAGAPTTPRLSATTSPAWRARPRRGWTAHVVAQTGGAGLRARPGPTGRLQLFLRRNLVQPDGQEHQALGYAETNLLDLGDIIEATGKIVRTERAGRFRCWSNGCGS